LRFVNDLPQVIISFDEQKGEDLCFTVILVRVKEEGEAALQELFSTRKSAFKFVPDRVRKMGEIRRKYAKEATVFRAVVASRPFIRLDRSVDLYKAREHMLAEISRAVGELRDYNGGMIYKQNESLNALKSALGKTGLHNSLLLEKFFYSLTPTEM